jgi:hypothetical protein
MRRAHALVIFALLLTAPGCGRKANVHVWGEISFNGTPIEQGEIEFKPIDGTTGPATGGSITAGHYDVPERVGPLAGGTYLVSINGYAKIGRKIQVAPGQYVDALDNVIPEKYNRQSTLRITIDGSAGQQDFKLEGRAGK